MKKSKILGLLRDLAASAIIAGFFFSAFVMLFMGC